MALNDGGGSAPMKGGELPKIDTMGGMEQVYPDLFQKLQAQSRVFLLTSSVNPRDMRQAEACILIEKLLAKPLKVDLLERLLGKEVHPDPD